MAPEPVLAPLLQIRVGDKEALCQQHAGASALLPLP